MRTFTPQERSDIRMMYRQARNRQHQITILSDMYVCQKNDILLVLGLDPEPEQDTEFEHERKIEELFSLFFDYGMNIFHAAEKAGISRPSARKYIREEILRREELKNDLKKWDDWKRSVQA